MINISSKLYYNPFLTFWVIVPSGKQTKTDNGNQKHSLHGTGNNTNVTALTYPDGCDEQQFAGCLQKAAELVFLIYIFF